jgi:hypothetical protein
MKFKMNLTTELAILCHAEQVEAARRDFQAMWKPIAESYRVLGLTEKSIMAVEHVVWNAFRRKKGL